MGYLARLLEAKKRAVEALSDVVGEKGVSRARLDHHSKRRPRPCGITIHTGRGCTNSCLYCYAIDMGFPSVDEPYPLSPEELVLALALNPYVVPERTFAAFGSVVEPFLPRTAAYTARCIRLVREHLKLPCQVSTKMVLSDELLDEVSRADPKLSLLVTVVTIARASILEPRAPPPEARLESARRALSKGVAPSLFLRPLIPSVVEYEARAILELASGFGINSVVAGSLRITKGILDRLARAGIEISKIVSRAPRIPRGGRDQVAIRCSDLKSMVRRIAVEKGFLFFDSACQANVWSHGQYCAACRFGPCGDRRREPKITESDVNEFLEMIGSRARCETIDYSRLVVRGRVSSYAVEVLRQASRRRVEVVK
ncbi:MAG: radical SAM protein [Crenarchaeota archaeon]|nr:radical SAM protein [Thermoproteota archaeon]